MNTGKPTLDVIIVAHDMRDYIYESLCSCSEALRPLGGSLILVDDGSSDDTVALAKAFSASHPDIALTIVQTANQGPGAARNRGLKEVRSDYVCFVDADDLVNSAALVRIIHAMHRYHADMALPIAYCFDDGLRYTRPFGDAGLIKRLLGDNSALVTNSRDMPELLDTETSMCMRIFRAGFLQKHGIEFDDIRFCEDVYPSRAALLLSNAVLLTNETYYYYRQNRPQQRTSDTRPDTMDVFLAIDRSLQRGKETILDTSQGVQLTRRLSRLVMWGWELTPLGHQREFSERAYQTFSQVPRPWLRALRRDRRIEKHIRRLACYFSGYYNKKNIDHFFCYRRPRLVDQLFGGLYRLTRGK
ncbi:glycosyltransferase family 2 protein [Eleftheria terrae]|uniref:glycosyltransferase family 2 protein n=1 Tax=Eleftheria terrae TaxID=1597781 RepID=UPI00263B3E20|nr:glycosyltransferase family 2 protein [Eleftheria terrae]WKB54327.1 glycosyltransferase [Eleftheria terrae]